MVCYLTSMCGARQIALGCVDVKRLHLPRLRSAAVLAAGRTALENLTDFNVPTTLVRPVTGSSDFSNQV